VGKRQQHRPDVAPLKIAGDRVLKDGVVCALVNPVRLRFHELLLSEKHRRALPASRSALDRF
jgi:hypothetical protein